MPISRAAGPRERSEILGYHPWLHGFTIVVLAATFLLLLAGGNVTSRAAGLAVPDWPLSFHQVNPNGWTSNFGGSQPGVRDEHGHRLVGATVGFLVTVLAIWLAVRDPRRWVKWMGLAAWLGVVAQGVMGGLRVTERSVTLAVVHGCFAQAFFCLIVSIVAVTSRRWGADCGPTEDAMAEGCGATPSRADHLALTFSAIGCVPIVYLQVILGAVVRHTQSSWIPHMSWAAAVGLALMTLTRFVYQHSRARRVLANVVVAALVLYCVQIILGLSTLMAIYPMWSRGLRDPQTFTQVWLPTIHLAAGASLLGLTMYVAVRAIGLGRPSAQVLAAGDEPEGVPA